jgi:RNA polymerase sigma factor (sigma-70 family)
MEDMMEDPTMDPATPAAFESLIAHREWVHRLARSLVLDEARADDLEQEVWLEALVRPPRDGRSPRGWLATALRHNAIDEARVEKRRTRRETAAARPEAEPSSADLVAEADALQRVVRAVLDLPEPYRSTLLRRYFEDLGPAAIAARERVPLETVRTRLRRGLDMVRERFDRENDGDRRAWCLLLLPLARRAGSAEAAGTAAAGTAAAFLAFLTWKAAVAAAVLAAAGIGAWAWSGPGVAAAPVAPPAAPVVAAAKPPAPPPAPPAVAAVPAPAAAKGMRIEVDVRDAADRPASGAVAALRAAGPPEEDGFSFTEARPPTLEPPAPRETRPCDGEGRAVFEGVPAGEWTLTALARGALSRPLRVRIVEDAAPPPLRLLLLPAGAIEGKVARKDGKPLGGVLLSAIAFGGRGMQAADAAARTDAAGAFRIEGIRHGRYMLVASLPGGALHMVPREVVVPGAGPQEFSLDDSAAVRVRVVDDATDKPVAGARILLMVVSPGPPPGFGMASVATGADGTVEVGGLPPGQVQRFLVRRQGFLPFPGPKDGPGFASAALAPAKPFEATVRLRKGATLKGSVTDRAGKGLPKAEVWFAWMDVKGNQNTPYRTEAVTTDDRGGYSLASAGPGAGVLVGRAGGFCQPDLPADLTRALSVGVLPEAWRVTVPESGEVVKDLVLTACGTVEGVVADADGKPVPGAAVSVEVPLSEPISRWMDPPAAPPAWTDDAGRFRLDGLAPGDATIRAVHGPRGLFGRTGPVKVPEGGVAAIRVDAAPGAVLSGTVAREDGTAVAGALLRIAVGGVDPGQPIFREKTLDALEADAEVQPVGEGGAFRVAGLPAGKYTLFAAAEGCSPVRGTEVDLAAGEVREGLRIVLGGERFLAGRVVDEDGSPVPGARITVQDVEEARVGPGGVGAGHTDAEGRFRIPGLTAPRYRVRAQAPGRPDAVGEGTPGGGEVVLRLRRGLAIGGVVVDAETGKPLAGIPVGAQFLKARSINDREGGNATTGPDGTFRLEGLGAGPYRVVAGDTQGDSPYSPEVLASVEAGTTDLRVALRKGGSIGGHVLDESGKPLASRVSVFATRLSPDGKPDYGPVQRSVSIGPDGAFRFVGLAPGRYALMFSPVMGPGAPGFLVRHIPDVATGTVDLVVRMAKGVVVKGRIVKEDGTPVTGQRGILTVRPTGASERDFSDQKSVEIHPDGTFETEPLDPERTWEFAAPSITGYVTGIVPAVKPRDGEVVITLRKGGSLHGHVLDEDGKPVPGLWVGAQAVGSERGPGFMSQARTGEDGSFLIEGLGDFHFRIKTMGGDYLASTSEKEFVPGEEAEVRVKKGFRLSGRLVDAAGKGVHREAVYATPEGGGEGMGVAVAEDGTFQFRGLPKGRYALWLRADAGRIELGTFDAPAEKLELPVPEEK